MPSSYCSPKMCRIKDWMWEKSPLLRFMLYRLVKVQKPLNLLLVVQMIGNSAKAVILGDGGKIILSIVLP